MSNYFFGVLLAGAAQAEDMPDQRPALRIEAGMHTAQIKRIGVDAACSLMVTGSDDKTARLWALPEHGRGSPTLLRTLRVPIGEGDEGKVYAVALSPDGKWVASGGSSKNDDVYIFEAATGRLVMRLSRLGSVINHLAFSPDGSRLVAALSGGEGMRLWETGSWRLLAEDKNYSGKGGYGAAFDRANRLYTVADDSQIRRYDANGSLEKKAATKGGKQPFSIAPHPNGVKLAIGFNDTAAIEVYDARTLERLHTADTSGITGGEQKVAWSADGARLFAGGKTFKTPEPIVIWQGEGRGKRTQAPLSKDTLMQLLPCANGIAAGAQDPAFGLIAANGEKNFWQDRVTGDMRNKLRDAFTLSNDGKRVQFGLGYGGKQPVLFDLAAFRLADAARKTTGLAAPKTANLAITDWQDKYKPKLNGEPIALEENEDRARSLSRRMHRASSSARSTGCALSAPTAANFGGRQSPASPGA